MKHKSYVLVTPAHNEEASIEKTIQSVILQTILPKKWVIVNDGSIDRTNEIIRKYRKQYNWIELIRMPEHKNHHFAAKANCFNEGYKRLNNLQYDIIGNLDADISFDRDYFEFLLNKFAEYPKLGVAGTPFVEGSSHYDYRFTNIEHVSGACQLFRRECLEQIGGYTPIKGGGIDWLMVTTARMKGWDTRTFVEKICLHHKKMGMGNSIGVWPWFRHGYKDYYLGGHPLWEVFRTFYQMARKPYIIRGLFIFFGYAWAALKRVERPVSQELLKFHRAEQMKRLKNIFLRAVRRDPKKQEIEAYK